MKTSDWEILILHVDEALDYVKVLARSKPLPERAALGEVASCLVRCRKALNEGLSRAKGYQSALTEGGEQVKGEER